MAQTNFTPISLYYSATAAATPSASNLVAGELAINTLDGKLFYKDSAGVVQVIGTKGGVGSSTTTQVLYNSSGLVVGSANLTFNGTTLTVANDAFISGLTVGKGGGAVNGNTAFGLNALATNDTTAGNTALGRNAMYLNTTGSGTAVGSNAYRSNTTGAAGTAVGLNALYNNTTGGSNTAVGQEALVSNTTASYNTAVGYQAGYSSTTAQLQTCVGYQAGYGSTGSSNTFVGNQSGVSMTSGAKNTLLGAYNGNQGGLDIRTASNYIVLSDGDGNPRYYINSSGQFTQLGNVNGDVIGTITNANSSSPYGVSIVFNSAAPNNSSSFFIYSGDNTAARFVAMSNGGIKNYSANNVNLSDESVKKDIQLAGNYLDKICAIPVKTFLYIDQTDTDLNLGVIAQDVHAVAPELTTEVDWGTKEEPNIKLSVYESDLMFAMMKSIQELNTKLEAQALEIAALKVK